MFHRIQPSLHLDAADMPNPQLDTEQGRLWLQLEWRALAAALAEKGPSQAQAIRDALAFRARRRRLFPGTGRSEASLEIAEGIPEYTGYAAGMPDRDSARWRAISKLTDPDPTFSFVRSFSYTSGPAYGLLLDERLPGWRAKVTKQSDLGDLLGSTVNALPPGSDEQRASTYGATAIQVAEVQRAAKVDALRAHYRELLVNGPTLTLAKAGHFKFGFNPSTLISLGNAGNVYPTFHASDAWGTLEVTDGALVPTDFTSVTVTAPANISGQHLQGPGWTLDLASGWHVVPGPQPRTYVVRRE
jgi:hypothetical protein